MIGRSEVKECAGYTLAPCLLRGGEVCLRTSHRMNPGSNERRVQRAFKHARYALIDRTSRSRSIDRSQLANSEDIRPRTRPCRTLIVHRTLKCTSRARETYFRLPHGFADLPGKTKTTVPCRFYHGVSTFPATA